MLQLAKPYGGSRILDLGCGDGIFLPSLSEAYQTVHGLDLKTDTAQMMVRHFKLDNVSLYNTDLYAGSLEDGSYDIIFAASFLEHFSDREKLITRINDLLSPGGCLVYSSPTETWLYALGRKMFGYVKPLDHYYSCDEIGQVAANYLKCRKTVYGPFRMPRFFAAYGVFVFQKPVSCGKE